MARWRDIKNKKENKDNKQNTESTQDNTILAPTLTKIKSFITDMFMLMMPLSYFTTYFILDGKNDFQANEIAKWGVSIAFGIVSMIFWNKSGQTPGYKAYEVKIVDKDTHENISYMQGTIRYIIFIVSYSILFGMLVPLFRKDKQSLHDMLSDSCVISFPNTNPDKDTEKEEGTLKT